MRVLDLFSGIGGFSLGLERAGMETIGFCEADPYCQQILLQHWGHIPVHDDVRTLDGYEYRGAADVVTGGFPCQDISTAGKRGGIQADRSGLFFQLARIISEVQPRYAIMENVTNLISGDRGRWFGAVLGTLAEIGYDAEWHCIPASTVGANHQRDRVWIVAYPNGTGQQPGAWYKQGHGQARHDTGWLCQKVSDTDGLEIWNSERKVERCFRSPFLGDNGKAEPLADALRRRLTRCWSEPEHGDSGQAGEEAAWWATEPDVGRVANGIPCRVDRIKSLGNSIVPQIAQVIGEVILERESHNIYE